jgi:uncharacterized protein (TIGR03067 family)
MRCLALTLLGAFLLAGDKPKPDPTKDELKKLQGDWALLSETIDGIKISDDEAQSLFITVKDHEYTMFLFSKSLGKVKFKIDPTKKPKEIDLFPGGGLIQEKKRLAIYELKGDEWKICSAAPGKKRPTEFGSSQGSGHNLFVYEREKK